MDHKSYDSKTQTDRLKLTALYYNAISPTTVSFPQEKISVFVNSLGHVESWFRVMFDCETRKIVVLDRE